jgi:4-amino-4-deoxy-L-arabinose transferase-like glycosyltransferase
MVKNSTLIIVLSLLFYLCMSIFYLFYGIIHADEATYLYSVKMILAGKLIYKDFFYIQLPMLPYLFGMFLKFMGVNMITGRIVSIIFSFGAVLLTIVISKRIGGSTVSAMAALLLCLNPFQGYSSTITRVYSPAMFFLVLSIYFLMVNIKPVYRNTLSLISLSIAIECRLTILPAVVPIILYFLIFDRDVNDKRSLLKTYSPIFIPIIASFLFVILTLLPFVISVGCYAFFYQNFIYHINMEMTGFIGYAIQKLDAISTFFKGYYFISVLLISCCGYYIINARRYKLIIKDRNHGLIATMWIIVILITLAHFCAKYLQPSYQVVIFPLACIIAAYGAKTIFDQFKEQNIRIAVAAIFSFGVLITPVSYGREFISSIDGKTAIRLAREAGDFVRSITKEDDLIMSSDTPLLAIEADRWLLKGFENMEYYPDWSTEKCKKYNLVNDEILEYYITKKIPKLIIVGDLSYTMSMPYRKLIGNKKHNIIFDLIKKNYTLIKTYPNLTYSISGTNTYIFTRKIYQKRNLEIFEIEFNQKKSYINFPLKLH